MLEVQADGPVQVLNCLGIPAQLDEGSGFDGYVTIRRNAHASSKTLWTRSPLECIGFVVTINASQIGPWAINNAQCLTIVLHELIPVHREECHLERLGGEECTADGDT